MTRIRANWYFAALGLSAALMLAQSAQADSFNITVNTSGLQGTSGYLDFQFNPGNTPFDAASATITGFTTDGTLGAALPNIGDVSGALPGQVVINNTDVLNEYTQGVTYGSFFDVTVNLTIPAVSGTAVGGSSFTLDVEDSDFNSLLGSFPAVEIDLDATTGQPSVTNNTDGAASVVATPEPDSLWLMGLGFAGLVVARRRQIAGKGAVRAAN
jgi:hypothetical protein